MALTLRSIASPEQELNLCSLWLNHDYRFSPFPLTSYQTWQNSLLEKTSIGLSILCFIAFTKITDACAATLPIPTLPCGILPHTTDPISDEHRSKDIQFLMNREARPVQTALSAADCRSQWHRQSCKLFVLCCSVLRNHPAGSPTTAASHGNCRKATSPPAKGNPSQSSSGQAHQLLQTAAARLLMVLTDNSLWKCFQPGKQRKTTTAGQECELLCGSCNYRAQSCAQAGGSIVHCCSTPTIEQHRGSVLDQHRLKSDAQHQTHFASQLSPTVRLLFVLSACQHLCWGVGLLRLWGAPSKMPTESHLCLSPSSTGDPDAAQACSQLLATTSPSPVISLALRCLVNPPDPSNTSIDPIRTPPPEHQGPMPARAPAPLSSSAQTQSPEQEKQALIIQMTTHAALRPLNAHVPDSTATISGSHMCTVASAGSSSPPESGVCQMSGNLIGVDSGDAVQGGATSNAKVAASIAAAHFACHVLTAPQLLRQLPAASRKLLTQQLTLTSLMSALQQISASNGSSKTRNGAAAPVKGSFRGSSPAFSGKSCLSGTNLQGDHLGGIRLEGPLDALIALGNLAGLLAGERVTKAAQVCAPPVCKACLSFFVVTMAL